MLAIAAGADALCLGHDLFEDDVRAIRAALVEAVHAGRLPEERLAEAAARVERVGRWTLEQPAATAPSPGVGLEAARRALHVDGAVELTRERARRRARPRGDDRRRARGPHLRRAAPGAPARHRGTSSSTSPSSSTRGDRQLVVVIRDAHRHAWERDGRREPRGRRDRRRRRRARVAAGGRGRLRGHVRRRPGEPRRGRRAAQPVARASATKPTPCRPSVNGRWSSPPTRARARGEHARERRRLQEPAARRGALRHRRLAAVLPPRDRVAHRLEQVPEREAVRPDRERLEARRPRSAAASPSRS